MGSGMMQMEMEIVVEMDGPCMDPLQHFTIDTVTAQ